MAVATFTLEAGAIDAIADVHEAAVPFVSCCKAKDGDVGIDTWNDRHHKLQTFCAEQSFQSFVNQDPRLLTTVVRWNVPRVLNTAPIRQM